MDSLRYWVIECHVDGFRFDLASALARELHDVDQLSAFFDVIHQDPILSQVKLIAEPWDVGDGGYQVGNFPVLWAEWNGKYRDAVRDFWRGAGAASGTSPTASPAPAISTSATAGGRSRRSTSSPPTTASRSPTSSPTTRSTTRRTARTTATAPTTTAAGTAASRARPTTRRSTPCATRQQRNFLATLLLSQGVPMLLGGDEMLAHPARQQQRLLPGQRALLDRLGPRRAQRTALLDFTRRLIALRREHPVLRRTDFLAARPTARRSPTSGGSAPTACG